jgi:chromosome segregation ATPase
MIWTILAVAAVVATKLVTTLRLKDLKAKLESIQPDIDELRHKVAESEEEFESLRLKEEASESRVTHLKGMVQHLENQVKATPASAGVMDERGAITQEAESIER